MVKVFAVALVVTVLVGAALAELTWLCSRLLLLFLTRCWVVIH